MGKVSDLNSYQKRLLDQAGAEDLLVRSFYFTGRTALSEFYLQHRESVDLDFFSQADFNRRSVLEVLSKWGEKMGYSLKVSPYEGVKRGGRFGRIWE